MRRILALTAVLSALAATPLLAAQSDEPELQAMEITLRGTGKLQVAAFLTAEKDRAMVCGVYVLPDGANSGIRSRAKVILGEIYFTIDGRSMTVDATKFKRFESKADFKAAKDIDKVSCILTSRKIADIKKPASFKMWLKRDGIAE